MKCNIKCPFFLNKNRTHYTSVYCRLEQDTIHDEFWRCIYDWTKDKECHMTKERILQMGILMGELDEM
jgi:hypothetical protein